MTLSPGTRLGPYEIVAPLGAGGMGEVYRAHDARLGRDVAIKLLPDAFTGDPERIARFEREARLLASLQHGNIAVLHGLEESDGRRFLVMECVEGESLAARLARGPLHLPEALEVGRAVAAALEAAHEGGIVHRDLKPGNVMVTPSGDVKVLDFGLAKGGASGSTADPRLSTSPTLTRGATQAGVILGTAAYMSPEQARGKEVDRRTDIWSYGCVMYECLTGQQAFAGETVSDIVARILQTEPEWTALPAKTPERLRALMGRCLEKDVKRRQRDIGDVRIELEDLLATRSASSSGMHVAPRMAPARRLPTWAVLACTAVVAAAAAWVAPRLLARPVPRDLARFEISGPRGHFLPPDAADAQLSPDGRLLALIVADSSGATHIWLRRLDSATPRLLPGTENCTILFWSPDSRHLGFFAGDHRLSRIAVAGGDPEGICEVKTARGGSWNRDGVILLAPYSNGGIFRVPAGGGDPVAVTHPDSAHGETGHRFPCFLPDGRHFLFSAVPAGSDGKGRIMVGSLDGSPPQPLTRSETGALYCAPGWLLTTRDGVLQAQRFDAGSRRLRGEPIPLGDTPQASNFSGAPAVSASTTGSLAYVTQEVVTSRLAWLDLDGRETAAVPVPAGIYVRPLLSPDARRAVVVGTDNAVSRTYVAVTDLERGVLTRISDPPESGGNPAWSPDGHRVAYLDDITQALAIRSLVDGSRRTLLASDRAYKRVDGWSHDGRYLLIERLDPATKWDLWLVPVEGGAPRPLVRTPANENGAALSPDGRWVAFVSDESGGTPEVFVQSCESAGMKYQVTTGGGGVAGWSADGKRLFFASAKNPQLGLQADVQAGVEFSLGPARPWFHSPPEATGFDYDHDARRVLALLPAEKAPPQTVTLIQNWREGLRRP